MAQNEQDFKAAIDLTPDERELVSKIDFNPASAEHHDAEYWRAVGEASVALMRSLIARKGIPEIRTKYFTDPEFNIGGRGKSRAAGFEKNHTQGEAIFRHGHFLKYLHYFLHGPDLPPDVVEAFRQKIADIGFVTSSDIVPLGAFARQLARTHRIGGGEAAEEFFKLALELGLELHEARVIRDSVKIA
jgi:hypothetical protein